MCNKKLKKIFPVILLLFFLITGGSSVVFATTPDNFDIVGYENPSGNEKVNNATQGLMGTGIEVIRIVGVGISIIMLSYIGIKYMMAAPDERAEFKKSISIYVLGAVLIFAASNILVIVANFVTNF